MSGESVVILFLAQPSKIPKPVMPDYCYLAASTVFSSRDAETLWATKIVKPTRRGRVVSRECSFERHRPSVISTACGAQPPQCTMTQGWSILTVPLKRPSTSRVALSHCKPCGTFFVSESPLRRRQDCVDLFESPHSLTIKF